MSINLGSGGQITYQQWKTLTPLEQSQIAATLGFDPLYVDTQLSAGEQVQGSTAKPGAGGGAPSSTLPNLTTPNWDLISPDSYTLVQSLLSALGFSPEQAAEAFYGGDTESLAFIQQAIEEYTNEEGGAAQPPPETVGSGESPTPPPPDITGGLVSGLTQLMNQVSSQVQAGTVPAPENYANIVSQISSQNPDDVKAAIFQLVDLSNMTDDQKTFVTNELDNLSTSIASAIASGGSASFFLRLGIPELLTVQFSTVLGIGSSDSTMSPDNQNLMMGVLTQLANNLSTADIQVATGTPPPSQEYQQLTSQDPTQVATLLTSMLSSLSLPAGTITPDDQSALISALAAEITSSGTLPTELTSSNQEVVANYLSTLITNLGNEGKISSSLAASLAGNLYLIPGLASQIASLNQTQCINNLYSSDPTVISGALHNLGGTTAPPPNETLQNLPPDQVIQQYGQNMVVENYLQALVKALAFMGQIRALINQLENQFSQDLANAKLSNIADQVQTAIAKYKDELSKLQTDYDSSIKAIHKQQLMKWLMPLITILLAVIMAIITVVGSIVSGGFATAAIIGLSAMLIAKMIVAVVMIVVTIAMTVLSVVDAARSVKGDTEIWTALAQAVLTACNVKNQPEWLKSLVNALLQTVIAVLLTVLTLGAGIGTSAAMIAKGALEATTDAMAQVMKALGSELSKVALQLVMTTVVAPIMSSGVLMQGILAILQACGSKNDKTNAIIAMVVMILTMIAMMIVGAAITGELGAALKGIVKAGQQLGSIFKALGSTISDLGSAMAGAAAATGKALQNIFTSGDALQALLNAILQSLKAAAEGAVDATQQLLANLLKVLQLLGKAIAHMIPTKIGEEGMNQLTKLLNTATQLTQLAMDIYNAVTDFEMAAIQEKLADLNKKIANLESSSELMQMLSSSSVDPTTLLKELSEDAKNRADSWSKLVDMVTSFIQNASQNFSQLAAKAGG